MSKKNLRTRSLSTTSILIIYTGGTIGMVQDHHSGVLTPIDFSQIREAVPEIKKFGYAIDVVSFDKVLDSSDMQPSHWIEIAKLIRDHYKNYDGFVILHGSDTLAYTSSALSYMLENLSKPVILTGSQLPVGEIRTDAKENLVTAIEIAATKINNKPAVPEVCIYFDYSLFRGNRVTKINSSKFEAFQSLNYPALAEAGVHIKINSHLVHHPVKRSLKVHLKMDNSIGIIRIFPGMTKVWFVTQLRAKGIKAVIIETFGSGNAPSAGWFIDELQKTISSGILVVNVSQCPGGMVEQGRYATSSRLAAMGVVSGADITIESALTKLMFLFGKGFNNEKIKMLFKKPVCGEMSVGQ